MKPTLLFAGRRRSRGAAAALLALAALVAAAPLAAQVSAPAANAPAQAKQEQKQEQTRGLVMAATFEGSSSSDGQIMDLNTSSGYNFNKYFGVDVGMPFYFVRSSSTITKQNPSGASGTGIGNVYADARLALPNPVLPYGSSFTVSAPTGNQNSGRSTGHWTWNWSNHVEHALGRFTPFVDGGFGDTVADTRAFNGVIVYEHQAIEADIQSLRNGLEVFGLVIPVRDEDSDIRPP